MTPCLPAIVTALAMAAAPSVDFDTDVVPILTKAGCNAAACHGAAAGRGGFKLSLFGGDPAWDYREIVHQLEGRRINLARPVESLLLAKPTEELDHGGGYRLESDGPWAARIAVWIREGAPRAELRSLAEVRVQPEQAVVGVGQQLQVRVAATFDGGAVVDATDLAVYASTDAAAVEVSPTGQLTVHRRGRHAVIVRYLSEVRTVQITVPLANDPIDLSTAPRHNWIDGEVLGTLQTLRLPPSPQADAATLLRRVRLDLTGRLPTPDEVRQFLADEDPDRFSKLVDRLLASPDFTAYWSHRLAELLRIQGQAKESAGARAFHFWVREQLQRGAPWNEMAVEMLTAVGDRHLNGPANFYRLAGDPRAQAEYVSEVLMGVRLRCANCHNHPLDRWTQDDYHGLAAIFARVEGGRQIRLQAGGEVIHPATGEAAQPRIPGERYLAQAADGRRELAEWLADEANPYFAKAMVNRVWRALMGRGLIEPSDDLRSTNPATHPRLLDRLAEDFVEHRCDLRHTIGLIVTSAAYARSSRGSQANAGDDRFYSHALVKPLTAEVLADAIADVTGIAERYGDLPQGTRAIELFDPRTPAPALDILGRCARDDSCEATGGAAGGLTAKLHMLNGPLLNRRIVAASGRLHEMIEAKHATDEIVTEFYLRALGRLPAAAEHDFWSERLADGPQRSERLEDFLWSLLNCRDFVTNH